MARKEPVRKKEAARAGAPPAAEGVGANVTAAGAAGAGGSKVLHTAAWIERQLDAFAAAALAETGGAGQLVVAGIRTHGALLADRLAALLERKLGRPVPVARLDVTLYRDDLSRPGRLKAYHGTEMLCPIDEQTVILLDDVFYTGRTIRAALDLLMDFGRPRAVRLYVLLDRGGHELPLRPDLCGEKLTLAPGESVRVHLKELDGEDAVVLAREQ